MLFIGWYELLSEIIFKVKHFWCKFSPNIYFSPFKDETLSKRVHLYPKNCLIFAVLYIIFQTREIFLLFEPNIATQQIAIQNLFQDVYFFNKFIK